MKLTGIADEGDEAKIGKGRMKNRLERNRQ